MIDPHFLGLNGFTYFFGIVEDRKDPEKLGRVRVRCFGIHTDNKIEIPTESLPWASVMIPTTSASTSGVGDSPTGLIEGSQVVGFFTDGMAMQSPIIMGSIAGKPEARPSYDVGFSDPNQIYPVESRLNDVNDLARNDDERNIHDFKKEIEVNVKIAGKVSSDGTVSNSTWTEQTSTYNASYPYNSVSETESGHVTEQDDTIGASRTTNMHRSGTFEEIHNDGTKVTKILHKNYHIVIDDDNVAIGGNCNITIDGNANLLVNGDCNTNIVGDKTEIVKGNYVQIVEGSHYVQSKGSMTLKSNTTLTTAGANASHTANGSLSVGSSSTTINGGTLSFSGSSIRTNNFIVLSSVDGTALTPVGGGSSLNVTDLIVPTPSDMSSKRNLSTDITSRVTDVSE